MKYLFILVAVIVAGYYYNNWLVIENKRTAFPELVKKVSENNVSLFDAKKAIKLLVQLSCEEFKEKLEARGSSVSECLQYQENFQSECDERIFRLAPIEFSDTEELLDYSRRYHRCIMPTGFSKIELNHYL
ncbi:hypothetical protein [Pseudoalteromonas denitrificans]|uniref:Uncharacterized protein n=1 Tax=Pseudoalteromonas denitrificans DSM 6059 TaxID=1123010 RepID=A0A1I1PIP7_9GAMM|nr:hypothetical protein [Pseudoalteromonas denitrificans]SFD09725.1 hypothetical protein SAMN02745724_03472 [Pseudoalteromonas denitrificans DSM 6059]